MPTTVLGSSRACPSSSSPACAQVSRKLDQLPRSRPFERVSQPRRSAHNPDVLEERTITEADVYEFSFVTFPQYEGATARVEEAK